MKSRIAIVTVLAAMVCARICAADQDSPAAAPPAKDNEEVARMYAEDQSDRESKDGKPIDWNIVGPRDEARLKRIMILYAAGELKTGKDLFHAAMILQHGERPEDFLLCHDLCVAAVFKSGRSERASWLSTAKWLAAASEDRFLLSIGRAQRFGTQFDREGDSPWQLAKMEDGVTDQIRKAWSVPPLSKATERVIEMNKR